MRGALVKGPRDVHWLPDRGRDFARHAEVRQQVRPVRAHVDHDSRVGHRRQRVEQRRARRDVDIELQDTVLFLAQPDLARRAQHPVGDGSANLSPLDSEPGSHLRPGLRERIELTCPHVRRAANDVEQLPGPGIDFGHREVIAVGMRRALDHARDDERGEGHPAAIRRHRPSPCAT